MAERTKFFASGSVDIAKIKEEIKPLNDLLPEQKRKLAAFLGEGKRLIYKDDVFLDELRSFQDKTEIPPKSCYKARKLARFLLEAHKSYLDPFELLIQELAEQVPLGDSGIAGQFSTYDFFTALIEPLKYSHQLLRRGAAVRNAMPFVNSISYNCNARMIPEIDFRPLEEDVSAFQPKPAGWVPVGMVALSTDEKTNIFFQVDLNRLTKVIATLQALEKELNSVKETLANAGLQITSDIDD